MILRAIWAVVGAITICAGVTFINRDYLRFIVRPFPADDYEVFIYSVTQIGPFIFVTAAFTLYHLLNRSRPRDRFSRAAAIVGLLCFIISVAADVLLMPRVRFR